MKRSEYIAIGAIGLLAVATFTPPVGTSTSAPPQQQPAANDEFQTLAFASLDECKTAQILTASTCETEFKQAETVSIEDAPKFEQLSQCEAEYGMSACRPALWQGASVFVPALAGVMVARALTAGRQTSSQPLYPPRCPMGASTPNQPECLQRSASTSASGSSGGGSSSSSASRSYYSTGSGRSVSRMAASVLVDAVTTPTTSSLTRGSGGGSWSGARSSPSAVFSAGRSVPSSRTTTFNSGRSTYSSPSPTISRGGFGATSRSHSSFGS